MQVHKLVKVCSRLLVTTVLLFCSIVILPKMCWAAPIVTAYTPDDGTIAAPSATVTSTFSVDMDPATITTGSLVVSKSVGIKQIAAGSNHTVALKYDGTVVAWGGNNYGQTIVPTPHSIYDNSVSGTISYNPATFTATFTPSAPLVDGVYHVTVAGPRSLTGQPLAAQTNWSFTVPSVAAPTVTTGIAGSITRNSAIIQGTVNDNGATATAQFEYGTTIAYGSTIAAGTVPQGAGSIRYGWQPGRPDLRHDLSLPDHGQQQRRFCFGF
jgi:hypothetical protein